MVVVRVDWLEGCLVGWSAGWLDGSWVLACGDSCIWLAAYQRF